MQEISERTGESMESLYNRISKGTMAVDEITESMRYATSEGGKFFNSMEAQSQTLNGQISTLKDNLSSFGGDLFRPLTDAMKNTLLPEANAILGQLQSAYASGGLDGMMKVVNAQLPRLLDAGTKAAQKIFSGISKQLPGLMKSLLSNLPSILTSAVDLVPQIADTLFTVAASAVEILVGKLPELVPTLVKGVGNLVKSIAFGIDDVIAGIFSGIEQAMHEGQRKIAGVWVDESNLAKYDFKLETDTTQPVSAIETAYKQIRAALNTDLLNDQQRGEIEDMIGEDYDAIYQKLLSFGLSEESAKLLAKQITDAGETMINAYKGLNVGVDAKTLARLTAQANGSRIVLKGLLKDIGLEDDDIEQVVAVYDEMIGKVGAATPSIIEEIYDKLTDGQPDDEQTVSALKEKIEGYINTLLSDLETAYAAKSAELDSTADDYQAKKKELDAWYESTKTSITEMNTAMTALVDELAGAPTAVVQARLDEFAEMERQLLGLEEKIDAMSEKARSTAEAAFKVVRSGAQADEATISKAISLKVTEFKLNEQEAEDAYTEAVDALVEDLANNRITQAEYETQLSAAGAEKEATIQAGKQAFDKAFTEIMRGIAESDGKTEALDKAMQALQAKFALQEFDTNIINPAAVQNLRQQLAQLLGDAFDPEYFTSLVNLAKNGYPLYLNEELARITRQVDAINTDLLSKAMGGKVGEAWTAALDQDFLAGTDFDVQTTEDQLNALFGAINLSQAGADAAAGFGEGMASADLTTDAARMEKNAENSVRTAFDSHSPARKMIPLGKDAAAGIGQGMAEADFTADAEKMAGAAKAAAETALKGSGENAGKMFALGVARGIRLGRSAVVNAAIEIARASVRAIKAELKIASPSRVTTQLGMYTGKGFELGMVESLNAAIRSAQSVVGSMNLTPRLTAPDLGSAFASAAGSIADAESMRPIYLNVNGRQLASVTAADTRRAQNSYNRKIALGVGK